MPPLLEDELEPMSGQSHAADVSTERAASAVEAASLATQSAAGAIERLGGWMALLASRAAQTSPVQAPREAALEAVPGAALEQENGRQGKGVTENIKRAALTMGQHINDLSDGRYGLEAQPPKAETKSAKKAQKRLERQARKEAKAEQFGAGVRWFPWMIGMSLGLVIGLVGVAYWQRRRLQEVWEQTSHRMQRATEGVRQRRENSSIQSPTFQPDMPTGMSHSPPLGSPAPADESSPPVNGRMQSTLP